MEPYLGQISAFAFPFVPSGWASCSGQLMPIAQNQKLFELLGTTYGGDGKRTFGLPDLRGRHPVSSDGANSDYARGKAGGVESVALTLAQMAPHTHLLNATSNPPTQSNPKGQVPAPNARGATATYSDAGANTNMDKDMLSTVGSGHPHANRQPFLALNFCIALQGAVPPKS